MAKALQRRSKWSLYGPQLPRWAAAVFLGVLGAASLVADSQTEEELPASAAQTEHEPEPNRQPRPPVAKVWLTPHIFGIQAEHTWSYVVLPMAAAEAEAEPRAQRPAGAALIDAGSDPKGAVLFQALEDVGLGPKDIHTVALTHGHRQQRAALVHMPQAQVLLGPQDVGLVTNLVLPKGPWARLQHRWKPAPPLSVDALAEVAPGSRITLAGHVLTSVPLPGHTQGSVAWLIDTAEGPLAFAGDSLVWRGGRWRRPWRWLSDTPRAMPISFRRLAKMAPTRLASSRGGVHPIDAQTLEALQQPKTFGG